MQIAKAHLKGHRQTFLSNPSRKGAYRYHLRKQLQRNDCFYRVPLAYSAANFTASAPEHTGCAQGSMHSDLFIYQLSKMSHFK